MLSPSRLAILIIGIAVMVTVIVFAILVPVVLLTNRSKQTTDLPAETALTTDLGLTTNTPTSSTSNSSSSALSVSTVTLPFEIDEYAFNKANTPIILQLSHPILEVGNFVLFTNNLGRVSNTSGNGTTLNIVDAASTNQSITIVNGFPANGAVLLSLIAQDIYGLPIFTSFYFYVGNITMPVRVLFANGTTASGVTVQMNLTDDAHVSQQGITNDSGVVVFVNVPPTTVSLFARTTDNQIGLAGVSPSSSTVTITLVPFVSDNSTRKRRQTGNNGQWLTVNTHRASYIQMQSTSFTSVTNATQVYAEYQFITQEVPGGFFGSQFNDYFSVTLRSSTGNYQTVSQSMNSLGLDAFNFKLGATAWVNLTMSVGPQPEYIQLVIGVSNVVDRAYQSQVNVDKYGSDKCDASTCDKDCSSQCTSDPMCSPTCFNPPMKSCQFYPNCMEEKAPCGSDGYALAYGLNYCTKFVNSVNSFSSEGQTWVYSTMNCLQKALISPLQNCENNCGTLESLAFSSHRSCYASNGVCDLPPLDFLRLLPIVGRGLLTYNGIVQAITTPLQCIPDLIIRIDGVMVGIPDSSTRAGLLFVRKWLQSL